MGMVLFGVVFAGVVFASVVLANVVYAGVVLAVVLFGVVLAGVGREARLRRSSVDRLGRRRRGWGAGSPGLLRWPRRRGRRVRRRAEK